MQSIRCRCGKIVCQVANMPQVPRIVETPQAAHGPAALILCRHCKRYVVLEFPTLTGIHVATDSQVESDRILVNN